ncbi:hypothetical protein NIES2130_03260 [Scytonema sp. HK-05]|nr:hypothetical protein NIES2130_03260 [Scytonema sp. HK-05]
MLETPDGCVAGVPFPLSPFPFTPLLHLKLVLRENEYFHWVLFYYGQKSKSGVRATQDHGEMDKNWLTKL